MQFTGTDATSGVAPDGCDAPATLATDGNAQSATGACRDRAGNSASATASGINIDRTGPVVAATAAPPPNANGWNNTNVTVSFEGADSVSGSGVANCSPPTVLSARRHRPVGHRQLRGRGRQHERTRNRERQHRQDRARRSRSRHRRTVRASRAAPRSPPATSARMAVPVSPTARARWRTARRSTRPAPAASPSPSRPRTCAGNTAANSSNYSVNAPSSDTTSPVIQPVLTGTLGSNGWYTSNVVLTWSVTDPESAVTAKTGMRREDGQPRHQGHDLHLQSHQCRRHQHAVRHHQAGCQQAGDRRVESAEGRRPTSADRRFRHSTAAATCRRASNSARAR